MIPTILLWLVPTVAVLASGGFWLVIRRPENNLPDIIAPTTSQARVQALRSVRVLNTPEEVTEAIQRSHLHRSPPTRRRSVIAGQFGHPPEQGQ